MSFPTNDAVLKSVYLALKGFTCQSKIGDWFKSIYAYF